MTTPTHQARPEVFKLYSRQLNDEVYFRAFPTYVEHWGPKIEGGAHDTVEQGRRTFRQYLDMGYKRARQGAW